MLFYLVRGHYCKGKFPVYPYTENRQDKEKMSVL
jgi:hypothetical protein